MNLRFAVLALTALLFGATPAARAQESEGSDPEAIIQRILAVSADQRARLNDVTFDAEYLEGERESDGTFKEKVRFVKRIYIKYFADTAWYQEDYIQYYKNGKIQETKERDKQARERAEKKKRRRSYDISYPMIKPFMHRFRSQYDISYQGISPDTVDGYTCHHFVVKAKEDVDTLFNGDFYFETEGFHLVRVDFSPAKLVKHTMFKLSSLGMSIQYAPTPDGFWLPSQFDITGKGKAMWVIGVDFAGTEYYRNPVVNSGLKNSMFEVKDE
jgi:hypothetical protein